MWDRQTKKSVVFPLPTPNTNIYGVEADKTDNIWVAEYQAGKVAKFEGENIQDTEAAKKKKAVRRGSTASAER